MPFEPVLDESVLDESVLDESVLDESVLDEPVLDTAVAIATAGDAGFCVVVTATAIGALGAAFADTRNARGGIAAARGANAIRRNSAIVRPLLGSTAYCKSRALYSAIW